MDSTAHNLTTVALARAGFECDNLREAEKQLGLQDLAEMIASSKALQDAWTRGRLLRRLGELASTPLCEAAAGKALSMTDEAFQDLLRTDIEAREIWRTGRQAVLVTAKTAIMVAAQKGEVYAVRAMERLLRAEGAGPAHGEAFDHNRVSMAEMERITRIARAQLLRWVSHGLPRDPEGCFSLPAFIAWLRKAPVGRTRRYRGKPQNVEKRLAQRIASVLREELGRGSE